MNNYTEVKKLYFTSDEVMERLNVSRPKLMYWANKLNLSPQRHKRMARKFTESEIDILMEIPL